MGVTESVPGPPPSRVMSFGLLSTRAPDGTELKGDEASEPVLLPARSAGATLEGRSPGTGAAVQTFSEGFFVCAHVVPDTRQAASIAIANRINFIPCSIGTPCLPFGCQWISDAVQAALLSWLLLGEALMPAAWIGIGFGVCGILILSFAGRGLHPGTLLRTTVQPAALCGLGAGAGFAVAGIGIKAATMVLSASDLVLGALPCAGGDQCPANDYAGASLWRLWPSQRPCWLHH